MKKFKLNLKQVRSIIISLTLVLFAGEIGYWLGSGQLSFQGSRKSLLPAIVREQPAEKQDLDFSLFWDVWDRLEKTYLDETAIKAQQMLYGAIRGMVASLGDPYTAFLSPEENKESKDELGGSFEGVGIQLGYKDGHLAVMAPLTGMPAEKTGVKAGDLILKIEDRETTGITLPEAVKLIRGQKGTSIKLTLLHQGETEPYEALITRETITIASVEVDFLNLEGGAKVAHLKLFRFGEKTNEEWQVAVNKITAECERNGEIICKGIIFDLRNNPGGFLTGSVYIASEFLKSGIVVIQENSDKSKETYPVDREGKLIKYPLVVLANQGSASASEIVAGALQEKDRAKIVGEPTFGKGTIQEAQDLEGGAGLHVTIARWLLPSGKWLNEKGLTPDFQLKDNPDTEADEQLEKAKEVLLK